MIDLIYVAVWLPLLGFLINGLFGAKIKNEKLIGVVGSGVVIISFLIVVGAFFEMLGLPENKRSEIITLFQWMNVGKLDISFGYQVDQLSIVMALVVTGVGSLIHIYSIGYMHSDKSFWRFFAYLNLFIFSMMNLIMADNFVLMFLGWEGVGMCSYLLIGFWYDRKFEKGTTGDAAKKAFVVNRIGDFGFLLGMFLIYMTFGSLNFSEALSRAGIISVPNYVFELIALFLFIGATGKSAQIPLYVWLPDAMAGPTPVSALIHAATMVTAGVYMVARTSVIFAQAPTVMMIVAVVGLMTAFFAATIGIVQNDIKKVLAYSTVSQLGYMFLAMGVGAFTGGIFHVMTHAFFKALLFLGAGAVIHSMHHEQDIRHYGGLKKYLPVTSKVFLIGAIAIAGIPPLSGFFSKDEILWYAFNQNAFFWVIGVLTAMITAFYMFRLYFLTFEGKEHFHAQKEHGHHHHDEHHEHGEPHESPKVMTIPLMVLAVLSIIGGFVGIPAIFSGVGGNKFEHWLEPIFKDAYKHYHLHLSHNHTLELALMTTSVLLAVGAILLARHLYIKNPDIPAKVSGKFKEIYNVLLNKYFVDEAYNNAIIKPIYMLSESVLFKFTDVKIIDGFVNGTAALVEKGSGVVRRMQTGVTQFYALIMMLGIVVTLFWIILSL